MTRSRRHAEHLTTPHPKVVPLKSPLGRRTGIICRNDHSDQGHLITILRSLSGSHRTDSEWTRRMLQLLFKSSSRDGSCVKLSLCTLRETHRSKGRLSSGPPYEVRPLRYWPVQSKWLEMAKSPASRSSSLATKGLKSTWADMLLMRNN